MLFKEKEGTTAIVTEALAKAIVGKFDGTWAFITLTIHSSLSAVGFMAVLTTKLAAAGISVNPVSAFYHDHLFVPWDKRTEAMKILNRFK